MPTKQNYCAYSIPHYTSATGLENTDQYWCRHHLAMHQAYSQLETLALKMQKKLWKVWPREKRWIIGIARIICSLPPRCNKSTKEKCGDTKKMLETCPKSVGGVSHLYSVSGLIKARTIRISRKTRTILPTFAPTRAVLAANRKLHNAPCWKLFSSISMVQDNWMWTKETLACSPTVRLVLVLLGSESLSPNRASDTLHFYIGSLIPRGQNNRDHLD